MAVDSISTATSSRTQINLQDFVRILTAQLNHQDPLKPMDNTEFLAQLAQFSSLEQSRQLNDKLDSLLNVQATGQSIGLIGKTIQAQAASGTIAGQVTQLNFVNGEPRLSVLLGSGQTVSDVTLAQVISVR